MILNDKQFVFRQKHSTYMAIAQLVDKINTAVEKNETTVGIFFDLSKAFDTIDHKILLHKLEHYGFRGIVFEWLNSYLNNRTQYVSYNNCESSLRDFYVVSHKDPFWVHYYLYSMLMVIHQMYLTLFCLQMTPLFFIRTKTSVAKLM